MNKIYLLLLSVILVMNIETSSQCTNPNQYPSATIAINPAGAVTTISTCSYAGEYSVVSGAVNGQTLRFTSSAVGDEITIRSGSFNGPVIAFGVTPLVFANTYTGTVYAHWNRPGCGSQIACRTTTVQCTNCTVPPPVNDLCTGAISIACGQTITGSTATATVDAVGTCGGVNLSTSPGVWYTFVGDGSSNILSLCGSSYDTEIGVFSGSCAALTCITANDDFCGASSQVTVATTLGTTYYVLVTGWSTSTGNFTFSRSCSCSGVPSPGVITGPAGIVCFGTSATLTLNGYTTGSGITIQWKSSSTPGGPYTNIAGANASTYAASPISTTYYVATVSCSASGFNATSAEFVLTISRPVHSNVIATPATGCAPAATLITGTVAGGITTSNYTHLLTGPATITQNASSGTNNSNASFTVSNMPAGTHIFTLRSTDAVGCSVSTTIPVTVNATPGVSIAPTTATICNGTIQLITASTSGNYVMTTSSGNSLVPGTTFLPGSAVDDGSFNYALPFAYSAYGTSYNSVNLSSNGTIQFTTNSASYSNVCPLSSALGIAFLPQWDDLDLRPAGGGIYTSVSGVAPNRILNIEWRGGLYCCGGAISFEARLYEGLQRVDFIYATNTGNGVGASIGVQNQLAGSQTTYSCNTASLSSGLGVSFSLITSPVIFSPLTELYTDALATVAYTGTPTFTIYAKPTVSLVYTASFTSAQGCTGTATSTITVNQLPAIIAQPVNVAVSCAGFNVNYSVTATGTGLSYQWQVSTNGGTTWTNLTNSPFTYAGVTTNALTVINPQVSQDNSQYRVVISGTCAPSVTSGAVTMRIGTPPTITSLTTNPAVPTICQNGNITFTAVAAGNPVPAIYQWQVSTNGGTTWTDLTTGGSYTSIFTITGAAVAQAGLYRVIVTNPCGQSVTSSNVTLTVNAIPTVTAAAATNRICISDTLVPLTGTPSGGSWSGLGTSGFNFVPAATSIGTFPIIYSFTNTFGCTNTSTINIKVADCGERIRRLIDNGVLVYPNPNLGRFNIKVNSTLYNYLGMKVYNTAGETVWTQYFNSLVYARVVPVNLSQLPNGTYIVKIYYDDGIRSSEKSFKMVIQK